MPELLANTHLRNTARFILKTQVFWYDTASWGELLPTFRKTVVQSSSRARTCSLVSLPLKMKALRLFETSGTIHSTQSVQYQKIGIPVKYAALKTSHRAGFCRTRDARRLCHNTVCREQPSVGGIRCCVFRLTCPIQT